jgi:hypothetical protein
MCWGVCRLLMSCCHVVFGDETIDLISYFNNFLAIFELSYKIWIYFTTKLSSVRGYTTCLCVFPSELTGLFFCYVLRLFQLWRRLVSEWIYKRIGFCGCLRLESCKVKIFIMFGSCYISECNIINYPHCYSKCYYCVFSYRPISTKLQTKNGLLFTDMLFLTRTAFGRHNLYKLYIVSTSPNTRYKISKTNHDLWSSKKNSTSPLGPKHVVMTHNCQN